MESKKVGIYSIICLANQKMYIGQSNNIYARWGRHKSDLRYGGHKNKYLQNEWDLYGEKMFSFNILEECISEELLDREAIWINKYESINKDKGFNFLVDSIRLTKLENSNIKNSTISEWKKKNSKKVEMYDLEGNLIRVFESTREVCEVMGFRKNRIQEVCSGKRYDGSSWKKKSYKGYVFKYENPQPK